MLVQELIRELQKFDENAELKYVNRQNKNFTITDVKIYEQNGEVCLYLKHGAYIIG